MKIEAKLTKKRKKERPHGIRYSLTLQTDNGERVLGYDNAHPIQEKKGKYTAIKYSSYDHRHRNATDKGKPYYFINARQLLVDFWKDVDKTLKRYKEEN